MMNAVWPVAASQIGMVAGALTAYSVNSLQVNKGIKEKM